MKQRQRVSERRRSQGVAMAAAATAMPAVSPPRRSLASSLAMAAVLAGMSLSMQGCDVPHISGYLVVSDFNIATHQLAQWRMEPEYWAENAYRDPDTGELAFNSCMNPMLSVVEVCNGHGSCAPFDPEAVEKPVFFCKCNEAWGGMECGDRRKRQSVAWFMSLLFGPLGLDELYLGNAQQALHKLLISILGAIIASSGQGMIGGSIIGFSWMFDVVRIGSGPVLSSTHRVQTDLPTLAFALLTVFFFCFLGVTAATLAMYRSLLVRRRHWEHVQCYSSPAKLLV